MCQRFKHLKRGTEYEVLFDDVEMQISTNCKEGDGLTIYRSLENGKLWARPAKEFHDKNRFEKVIDLK